MPATAKIAAPTHLAELGHVSTRRPEPTNARYARTPNAAHTIRYPTRNCVTPLTRSQAVARTDTDRVHTTTIGATEGSIMAAIITTHNARKARNVRPMVPGPMPIPLAWSTVTTQASAASTPSPSHHRRSCFSGRPSDGAFAASVSALVLEVGD